MPALTVTDLNRYIKALIGGDEILSAVAIRGEISNFKAHSSGHLYFTLKDGGAEIAAVMFRGDASRMNFRPADGMRVLVYGNVDVYEKSGRIQVYVRTMLADGVGAMAIAYERLKKKLEAEGLFASERKKPLPDYPSCIGVITAPTGAAIRDILNITGRRYPQAKILLYPSLVQGADAPASLCAGLAYFNADRSCDVIILGRGGGSVEDLWAFNDETLARAVAASQIPVISAVGHETDFTLCDFVADKRAPTPSAAAELAVPDCSELARRVAARGDSMEQRMLRLIRERRNTVLTQSRALSLLSPEGKLNRMRQQTEHGAETLDRLIRRLLERDTARLRSSAQRLEALSPLAVLNRGYSALQNAEGRIVRSAEQLSVGDRVELILADGYAETEIRSVRRKEGNA
ncbi:MAG: exodeoxyribonuclease VII large subunit [Clostridia bacterium]|nr:exodeoxyribonuclease VII large subunit [Clostridia bacterium]